MGKVTTCNECCDGINDYIIMVIFLAGVYLISNDAVVLKMFLEWRVLIIWGMLGESLPTVLRSEVE